MDSILIEKFRLSIIEFVTYSLSLMALVCCPDGFFSEWDKPTLDCLCILESLSAEDTYETVRELHKICAVKLPYFRINRLIICYQIDRSLKDSQNIIVKSELCRVLQFFKCESAISLSSLYSLRNGLSKKSIQYDQIDAFIKKIEKDALDR